VVVLAFILIGGFFAAAEMALVSLREGQIRALAKRGKRGQRAASKGRTDDFLAAVPIGVTVATMLSGAYGAETRVRDFRRWLVHQVSPHVADVISFIVVTLIIAFFSLVLGELAPKRIALQRQERIALVAAPVLDRIAVLARPLVWFISSTVNVVVRILGGDPKVGRGTMSSDELRDLVADTRTDRRRAAHRERGIRRLTNARSGRVLVPRTEVDFCPHRCP
jgi:putative hemolysin